MRTILRLSIVWGVLSILSACAHHELSSPCVEFGAYCHQTPINHWDNS